MRRWMVALLVSLALTVSLGSAAWADAPVSGQVAFGQATVEPAYDDTTGGLIFLLTPNHAPFPSKANPVATAPMYLPMYPTTSTVGVLNCLPTNCDHVQVLPPGLVTALGLQEVYPTGTISTKYGTFTGGLVKGHDHLVGVANTGGDFNVAWHVYLVLFTPQGVADGAINQELTTLSAVQAAMAAGDAIGPIDSGIIFNCSKVSEAVYLHAQS
jgi:hypothetical protein